MQSEILCRGEIFSDFELRSVTKHNQTNYKLCTVLLFLIKSHNKSYHFIALVSSLLSFGEKWKKIT